MKVTKRQIQEMFCFNHLQYVTQLLKKGTIIADDAGMIDLENKKNKRWAKARTAKLAKNKNLQLDEQEQEKQTIEHSQMAYNQLHIGLSNQNLIEKRAKLLELRIAKEAKELIEVEVMEKVMMMVFDALFQNIREAPSAYVDDIQNIFKIDKEPRETFIKFFTDKLTSHIQSSIDIACNKARKYYE